MKKSISELIQMRDKVQELRDSIKLGVPVLETFRQVQDHFDLDLVSDRFKSVEKHYQLINEHFDRACGDVLYLLNHFAEDKGAAYLREGYKTIPPHVEDLVDNFELKDSDVVKLKGRIHQYTNWHYPGVLFVTQGRNYSDMMAQFEPLYMLYSDDTNYCEVSKNFNEVYKNRVRPYQINEPSDMASLPINQIGFSLCMNCFGRMSILAISEVLTQMHLALRPGGVMIFDYNNANTVHGAKRVEWGGTPYTTESSLIDLVTRAGFEIVSKFNSIDTTYSTSWLEIKKPGKLTTAKLHPTLGAIEQKD